MPMDVDIDEEDELGLIICPDLVRSLRARSKAADVGSPKYVACDTDSLEAWGKYMGPGLSAPGLNE